MTEPAPTASPSEDPASLPGLRAASGILAAGGLLALVDVGAILVTIPMPSAGLGLRLEHLVFDVAETLGIAALLAAIVLGFARLRAARWVNLAVAMAATGVILRHVVGENVTRGVQFTVPARFAGAGYVAYLLFLSVLIPSGFAIGLSIAKERWLRLGLLALALVVMIGDHVPFFDDYQGVHGVVATGAALAGGATLSSLLERWMRARWAEKTGKRVLVGLGGLAALGVLVPPPNAVRYELFRQPCAVAPWVLVAAWRAPRLHGATPALPDAYAPWIHDRTNDPPVPPAGPRLLPKDAVVVLLTIDAVRADAVLDPANAKLFPTLTELMREGVTFTRAEAPGTQTPLSVASLFSGRTFSEQLWDEHGEGSVRFLYPADDHAVRFPEVLTQHGVETVTMAGLVFLQNDFGVLRGFHEEHVPMKNARHARAAELVEPLLARMKRVRDKPIFLYTHLTEPHEPYDRGRKDGTDYERYLSEITVADEYVGKVLAFLKSHFPLRWALIVSSDHGEAFGDHGTHEHAKSLYEELTHVPLFVASPVVAPRKVEDRVSLVDLGPTILDLFGLDAPAAFLGQSLVPLLAGGSATLTRPIFAEGRLRRALTLPDGTKVIEDLRRKTVEVYDLASDPKETRNLFDVEPARGDAALAALRAFFAAHTRTEGGYEPPFKP